MTIYVIDSNQTTAYEISESEKKGSCSILDFLIRYGLHTPETPCGGRKSCRKCRIRIRLGMQTMQVLACATPLANGMRIYLPERTEYRIQSSGDAYHYPDDRDAVSEGAASCEPTISIAADIGTTTVVCYLVSSERGQQPKLIDVISRPNAQRVFGADVMSRIQAAEAGYLEQEVQLLRDQMDEMCSLLMRRNGISAKTGRVAIVGNPTMTHLFAGISPQSLGRAPFALVSCFGTETADGIYLAPLVSAFIGGDIISDLIAIRTEGKKKPYLLLDIGTNGEIVLDKQDRWYACSAAAGPAFEGAGITMGMPAMDGAICRVWIDRQSKEPVIRYQVIGEDRGQQARGFCGSGLIDLLAVLLELGIMNTDGSLSGGEDRFNLTREVSITQEDIRQLQLAKAAMAAGIGILCREADLGVEEITEVLLAGGFGTSIDPQSAAAIGLIPQDLLPRTRTIGNAAGEGAISLAVSWAARAQAKQLRDSCSYLELADRGDFMDAFLAQIDFPDAAGRDKGVTNG